MADVYPALPRCQPPRGAWRPRQGPAGVRGVRAGPFSPSTLPVSPDGEGSACPEASPGWGGGEREAGLTQGQIRAPVLGQTTWGRPWMCYSPPYALSVNSALKRGSCSIGCSGESVGNPQVLDGGPRDQGTSPTHAPHAAALEGPGLCRGRSTFLVPSPFLPLPLQGKQGKGMCPHLIEDLRHREVEQPPTANSQGSSPRLTEWGDDITCQGP